MALWWLTQRRANYARLRRIADTIEAEYRLLPYEALLKRDFIAFGKREIDGLVVAWTADAWPKRRSNDVAVEVLLARVLPTLFGIRPCVFFHKRPDGTVY